MSVLALQHLVTRTHATQLYKVSGGRGLSWVTASVTVRAEHVENVSLPLVLAVRARRGSGPEGDIALDHLSVLAGPCHLHPSLQPNLTLHPTFTQPDALALSAGPALTPLPARDPPDDPTHPSEDSCTGHNTCSSCVAGEDAGVQACTWCDLTQRCVGGHSPAAAACPRHLAIHHNTSVSHTSTYSVPCFFILEILADTLSSHFFQPSAPHVLLSLSSLCSSPLPTNIVISFVRSQVLVNTHSYHRFIYLLLSLSHLFRLLTSDSVSSLCCPPFLTNTLACLSCFSQPPHILLSSPLLYSPDHHSVDLRNILPFHCTRLLTNACNPPPPPPPPRRQRSAVGLAGVLSSYRTRTNGCWWLLDPRPYSASASPTYR